MQSGSIAQFIQYYSVDFLNEFWSNLSSATQVFYDRGNETFLFRDQNSIYVSNKSSLNKVTKIKIPYNDAIYSMSIQPEMKYIAYQTSHNQLNVFSIKANRQYFYKLKSDKVLLQYEWTQALRGYVDLILVESGGVHMFKVDDGLKEVKHFSQKTSCCWYEPKNEVLVTDRVEQNGLLQAFYFNEKRKDNKYKGPEFFLEDFNPKDIPTGFGALFKAKRPEPPKFIVPTDRKNKELSQEQALIDSTYKIYLVSVYGKSLLAFSNSFSGKIVFYLLQYDKVSKQNYTLTFPSDIIVNLSVVDNLIVLSALNERISIVFDIKKTRTDTPLGPPQSILQQKDMTTIRVRDVQKKKDTNDNKIQESPREQQVQSQIMNSQFLSVSPNMKTHQLSDDENTSKKEEEEEQVIEQGIEQVIEQEVMVEQEVVEQDIQNNEMQQDISVTQLPLQSQNLQGQQVDEAINYFQSEYQQQPTEQVETTDLQLGYDVQGLMKQIKEADHYYEVFTVKMRWITKDINESHEVQSQIYEQNCQYLEDEIIVDTRHRRVYQFNLHLKYLASMFEEDIEAFLGLLRRSQCKQVVFEYLIDLVQQNRPIQTLSHIFHSIFKILMKALQERQANKELERLHNGFAVLYPTDIQVNLFQVLVDQQLVPRNTVIQLIVEFIRQFSETMKEYRLTIPSSVQNLLIKLLLKEHKFTYLHFLLQYQILTDNADFAKLLIEISSKEILTNRNLLQKYQAYEPAFQLGIDMLYRIGKYDDILEILLKNGRFHESAVLLKKYPLKVRLPPIQEGIRNADCSRDDIIMLFEDLHKKGRLLCSLSELQTL